MSDAIDRAAERPAILDSADSFAGGDPVNDLAILLMRTWGEAEPNSSVSRYPCCHVATFADMARAVQAAGLLAPGMRPTRTWRAVAPEGHIWCESSSEAEVRRHARPGDIVERLWATAVREEWRAEGDERTADKGWLHVDAVADTSDRNPYRQEADHA